MKHYYLNFEEQNAIQRWHESLDNNRGDRARLRRAERPEDILLTDAFFHFLQRMPDSWQDKTMFTRAAVAGLLSHVKADKQVPTEDKNKPRNIASFAELLAHPVKKGGKKPTMSELRFQQLQKSRSTDDFFRHVIRAIRLLDGKVNITSLANDIIHWHFEFESHIDREPAKRLAVRWAIDYFTALSKLPKKSK